ncbi:MAG: hypothetical protein LT105_07340 [Lentimicrobium sp.]|jgi:hypothetical protein|nr:hypothetical protein [Lentimicrobium sp.]
MKLFIKHIFILILTAYVFWGCKNVGRTDYNFASARIDSTRMIHWGRGFYMQRVYFSFNIDTVKYNCIDDYKLGYAYSGFFSSGDSALVKYSNKKPEESKIVKLVYKKRRIKL